MNIDLSEERIAELAQLREPDKTVGLLEGCSKNIVVFSRYMLGIPLYSWQVDVLNDIQLALQGKSTTREFAAMTSRQIGKSTAVSILSLWATIFNKYPKTLGHNTSVLITSASDVQAKKLLNEMKKLLNMGDRYMAESYQDSEGNPLFGKSFFSELLDDSQANNTTTISFKAWDSTIHGPIVLAGAKAGPTIKSYPPTSSVLGETASIIIIDEAGKTDKISDQFFYDFIRPVGTSTDAVYVYTSTPWVSSGFFYRIVDPEGIYPQSGATVKIYTIDAIQKDAPDQYKTIIDKFVEPLRQEGKIDECARAYYCKFVKGTQSYFDPEKVLVSFTDEYTMSYAHTEPCDMGVDFGGQVNSRTVITISELTKDGIVRRLHHKTYDVGMDESLINDMAQLMTTFNIKRIIPDDCPAGHFRIKQMVDKGWDVHPMNFRSDKVKKYGAFRSWLNKHQIKSYKDDELRVEMLALEFAHGKRNSNIEHAPGYSDDLIDSFLMSTYFFVEEEGGFKIFSYDNTKIRNPWKL